MSLHKKVIFAAIIWLIALTSCEETFEPNRDAVKFTRDELLNSINYGWFKSYWLQYEPDTNLIDSVKTFYNPDIHKIIIFIEPSCDCKPTDRSPADLLKSLDLAGISQDNYEIYSLGTLDSKHPYSNQIHIKLLPAAYLLKSGQQVYSIIESYNDYNSNQENNLRIEKFLLESLMENQ